MDKESFNKIINFDLDNLKGNDLKKSLKYFLTLEDESLKKIFLSNYKTIMDYYFKENGLDTKIYSSVYTVVDVYTIALSYTDLLYPVQNKKGSVFLTNFEFLFKFQSVFLNKFLTNFHVYFILLLCGDLLGDLRSHLLIGCRSLAGQSVHTNQVIAEVCLDRSEKFAGFCREDCLVKLFHHLASAKSAEISAFGTGRTGGIFFGCFLESFLSILDLREDFL